MVPCLVGVIPRKFLIISNLERAKGYSFDLSCHSLLNLDLWLDKIFHSYCTILIICLDVSWANYLYQQIFCLYGEVKQQRALYWCQITKGIVMVICVSNFDKWESCTVPFWFCWLKRKDLDDISSESFFELNKDHLLTLKYCPWSLCLIVWMCEYLRLKIECLPA